MQLNCSRKGFGRATDHSYHFKKAILSWPAAKAANFVFLNPSSHEPELDFLVNQRPKVVKLTSKMYQGKAKGGEHN